MAAPHEILEIYRSHNLHWESEQLFGERDPQLSQFNLQPLRYAYPCEREIPISEPGIYLLTGGRQLGKTTCLKKLIERALAHGVSPQRIFYLPCDTILDRAELYKILKLFLEGVVGEGSLLLIDEATYVKEWERTIKALADEGLLRSSACVITGSDKVMLEDATTRLPGRRGSGDKVNFEIQPLLFSEYLTLFTRGDVAIDLSEHFARYLVHGGYLPAINGFESKGSVPLSSTRTYQEWVMGDFLRLGKSKANLVQVLRAILATYGSPLSYPRLANHTEGLGKDSVHEYCTLLSRLGIIIVQPALDQNSLGPAQKKDRKFHFCDPFILRALAQLVNEANASLEVPEESAIVESICVAHFSRFLPTYYLKAEGEVDVVCVSKNSFQPIEIKWRKQVRPQDTKQLSKYSNGVILSRQEESGLLGKIPLLPLVPCLAQLPRLDFACLADSLQDLFARLRKN
jgi:predicted AAA+ superfamily ATPase